jgi:hypothetical protein
MQPVPYGWGMTIRPCPYVTHVWHKERRSISMATTVKKEELDQLIRLLNHTGDPDLRRVYPELGTYYLMGAYGGQKLVQIITEGGGVRDVLPHLGYTSKKELANGMRAYLAGRHEPYTEEHYQIPFKREQIRQMQVAEKVG